MDAWQRNMQRSFISPQHGRSVGIHILNLDMDYVRGVRGQGRLFITRIT
ncbi:hypothetical protein BAMEG_0844 [Bacillus anthracis str. CDC 684]|nr:hypothetical protein BAMEG_0844 [Bacillus anthracis str. CDC 684]